jgi:hypothetical protein
MAPATRDRRGRFRVGLVRLQPRAGRQSRLSTRAKTNILAASALRSRNHAGCAVPSSQN